MANLDMKLLVGMYLQGKSTKSRFTDAPILAQTNWYYEFSGFIENRINESERKQIEDMNKKSAPPTKAVDKKLPAPPKPKKATKKR